MPENEDREFESQRFDSHQGHGGCITDERLHRIVMGIQNNLPDHCGFVLIVAPFGLDPTQILKGSFASSTVREDAITALEMILEQLKQTPE